MIGKSTAHYRVTSRLGAGGMGEVYRATDTKLNRDVALKVLPEVFAQDAQRMARFQREAQVLASLNHPNIAAIYGLEESVAGETPAVQVRALVMELVEGPTLADRILEGAMPLEEALPIARQICEALEYAHERGIIHRDLKPSNIKLTPEGKVKVLDFGLAKAMSEDASAASAADLSPTLSLAATKAGIILGTAAYMSPEQAKGKNVDRRTDVWAFGAVLFEMLSGRRVFQGEDATEMLAAVIKSEPDWSSLPPNAPPHILKLLRRCLAKDLRQRLQAIGEARIQIEEVMADSSGATAVMSAVQETPQPTWRRALPWALAGAMTLAFVVSLFLLVRRPAAPEPEVTRFEIDLGDLVPRRGGTGGTYLAFSPDGKKIVIAARKKDETDNRLFLRKMDNLEFVAIPGTESASYPTFSPDSEWVLFASAGKLKKVSLAGGAPVTLCDAAGHATWGDDGTIVFSASGKLFKIPDGGGVPEALPLPEREGAGGPSWPVFLPGSRAILFNARVDDNIMSTEVYSLDSGQRETLIESSGWPRYLSSGHILYAQYAAEDSAFPGAVLAVPFDLKRLKRTGSPIPLLEGVRVGSGGAGNYEVSPNGTLVYLPGSEAPPGRQLAWLDRKGAIETLSAPLNRYAEVRISPEGGRVAVVISSNVSDIHVFDLHRGSLQRLTFEGMNMAPLFTPDGSRIAYALTDRRTPPNIWWRAADGSGAAERLTTSEHAQRPTSWTPDGSFLAFTQNTRTNSQGLDSDLFVLAMGEDKSAPGGKGAPPSSGAARTPRPFLQTKFRERDGQFSPDGKWMAYFSDESGANEVYVQPFPGPGGKVKISQGGGAAPRWSHDGQALYFAATRTKLMAVDIKLKPTFSAGTPKPYLELTMGTLISSGGSRGYDVAADGRVIFVQRPAQQEATHYSISVVQNFLTEVRRRSPKK